MIRYVFGFALVMWVAQGATADFGPKENAAAKKLPPAIRLMSNTKDKQLRKQLPKVEDEDMQRILEDPNLILYSDAEMPPAYQDWSSGLKGVHSPRYNISSNNTEPHGNGNVEFPWGTTGGTHRTSNVSTFRFVWLPAAENGQRRPIVWFRKALAGSTSTGYAWTFPVGSVVGEVLRMRTPQGKYVTFELRVREREYGEWAINVYRPFPKSEDLAGQVKKLRPNWAQNDKLAKLVQHLENPVKLTRQTLSDHHPTGVFRRSMGVDTLPDVGDDALVTELLTRTPFRSALGESWREGVEGNQAAAPTTLASYHVVPANYDAGFIEVDRVSCMSCHETVNRHVTAFDFGRDWYGRIRGSDGIFSLHPFDPASISSNGFSRPARINTSLVVAGLFERFDDAKHSPKVYQRLQDVNE